RPLHQDVALRVRHTAASLRRSVGRDATRRDHVRTPDVSSDRAPKLNATGTTSNKKKEAAPKDGPLSNYPGSPARDALCITQGVRLSLRQASCPLRAPAIAGTNVGARRESTVRRYAQSSQ